MKKRAETSEDVVDEAASPLETLLDSTAPAGGPLVGPPLTLGRVLASEDEGFRVRVGRRERVVDVDPSVDPALVAEAIDSGARVVVEGGEMPAIVGVLATHRTLSVDRHGDVRAEVRKLHLTAREEALLQGPRSFLRLRIDQVELYGEEVLTRARGAARVLARLIKLN